MTYERPDIQLLYALHAPGDQSISSVGKDLRADSNAGRDPLNLSDVSKHIALLTSARQAHWVFRDSRGKGIKGYVKEGVSQVLQNNSKVQTQPKKRRKELPKVPRGRSHRIYLRSTLPRAAHSASNPPKVGKGNGVDITGWLVSPSVRSIYAEEDGAVLLDIKDSQCYSLNGVAARVWVTIAGSPAGISFEGIVDALETHFNLTREALERTAKDCLAGLHLAGLIGGKVVGGNEAYSDRMSRSLSGGRVGEFRLEGFQTIIGEQPFVERLETLESLIDRVFPQGVNSSMDWRAKKLKDFIDKTCGKVHGNLGDVCKELELSLSDRQARRLFKESAGISIKEYARKRRLVFAAKQLQGTDEPIKVIATDAGYHTHQAFKKSFSDMFCISPKEFRRMWHRTQVTT